VQYAPFLNAEKVRSDSILKGKQMITVAFGDLQMEYKNGASAPRPGKVNYTMVKVCYLQ
jgi:hypothetical protein